MRSVRDRSVMRKVLAALSAIPQNADPTKMVPMGLTKMELVEIRTGLNSAHRWCDRATVLEEAAARVGVALRNLQDDEEVDTHMALEKACTVLEHVLSERPGVTTALVAMHRIREKFASAFRMANANISKEEEDREKCRQSGCASAFLDVVQRIDRMIGRLEQEEGRPWEE